MDSIFIGLRAELDSEILDKLADALASRIAERLRPESVSEGRRWMSTREAAEYLGLPVSSVHKLTAARQIPFEQDAPGSRCWFRREELDNWRRGEPMGVKTS